MKKRRNYNEVDYWNTLADAMLALFLCILLIVLLFTLYFIQYTPNEGVDDPGVGVDNYDAPWSNPDVADDHYYDDSEKGDNWHEQDIIVIDGGGGWGGYGATTERQETRVREDAPRGRGTGDDGEKSAVLVEVVDGETMLPILLAGVRFELYDYQDRLQTLNDYYPARVEHTEFQTTEEGKFYLPEKIFEGYYSLHPLSRIEGYAPLTDTSFQLERYYDWEEPYEVPVKVYPLRSVIRLRLVDTDTGEGIRGGSFQIIAAENITTLDGTVRFREGELADTITTNETGYAESRELYLGQYLLRQEVVPDYYGKLDVDHHTTLKEKTANTEEATETLRAEKTAMILTVRDALYDNVPVEGAKFSLSGGDMPLETLVSDAEGRIVVTNLHKNTNYRIRQVEATTDYRMDTLEHSFSVDGNGMIQGQVRQSMIIENRMIRVSFRVTGTLLGNRVSDVRMELTDPKGSIVKQWTTSGMDMQITGLEPGNYRLIIGGDERHPVDVFIADEANVQTFRYTRWTMADTGVTAVASIFLLGGLLGAYFAIRRRKQSGKGTEI